jgi:hypothetical protein
MHGPKYAVALTTALIAALLLLACGQHSSRVLNAFHITPHTQDDSAQDDNERTLPPDIYSIDYYAAQSRHTSAEGLPMLGSDYVPQFSGTNSGNPADAFAVGGDTLTLRATATGEYSWAVYSEPISSVEDPGTLKFGGGRDDEIPLLAYYIAVADYYANCWRWFGPYGEEGKDLLINTATLQNRFKSLNNNVNICIMTAGGSKGASSCGETGYLGNLPFGIDKAASAADFVPSAVRIQQLVTDNSQDLIVLPGWVKELTATPDENGIYLQWETAAEQHMVAYEIYAKDHDLTEQPQLVGEVDLTLTPDVTSFMWGDSSSMPPVPGKDYDITVIAVKDYGQGNHFSAPAWRAVRERERRDVSRPYRG